MQCILPLDTVLLSLADRGENEPLAVLEYMLLKDLSNRAILNRVDHFLALNVNKDSWLEDEFYLKQKKFEEKFPDPRE